MFKKTPKNENDINDNIDTIIGPSVKIEGDFKSQGNIVIGGKVIGKLLTTQNLKIEESADINADIQARDALIAGSIKGNINIDGHLELLASARVDGDISTQSIAIQQGAHLNGKCVMTGLSGKGSSQQSQEPLSDKKQLTDEWLKAHDEV